MYFDQLKHGNRVGWVSLNGDHFGPLFTIYASSFKNFKDKFFKLSTAKDKQKRLLLPGRLSLLSIVLAMSG